MLNAITPNPTTQVSVLVAQVTTRSLLSSTRGHSLYGFQQLPQPGLPTESGAWRTVARAGSRSHSGQLAVKLGLSQVLRPHSPSHSKPRISWWGGRGLVPAWGLAGHRGVVLSAHNSCCLPRARLQPPSSPADEDSLVPKLTICVPSGGRWPPKAQFRAVDTKSQQAARGTLKNTYGG